jgi:hypothetical protein
MSRRRASPALCAVFQTVSAAAISTATEAPGGPKRNAAQISVGKTT